MFSVLALVLLTRLAGQEPTKSKEDKVKDDAKLFKAETVAKADEAVRDLARKGIRLVIETYPTVPAGIPEKVKEVDAKTREKVFEEWARSRLETLGANAFDIVITNDPKHLQVTMGAEVRKKGFTLEDRQALTRAMLQRLGKGQIDEALLEAIATLRKHFEAAEKK
jgi:hypothetical protein